MCVVGCISYAFARGLPRHKYCGDAIRPDVRLRGRARRGAHALHDELIGCDEMPEGKQPMACGGARRGCGRGPRARATRSGSPRSGWQGCAKSATTRCAVRWRTRSPGSRSSTATETGRGLTTSPVGNDHSIDTVGYAMMDDSCMGENAASSFSPPSKGAKG